MEIDSPEKRYNIKMNTALTALWLVAPPLVILDFNEIKHFETGEHLAKPQS
jgi:hypothetical protein